MAMLVMAGLGHIESAHAEPLPREKIMEYVVPPYALGEPVNDKGVWQLLNSGGAQAGYVLETEPLAPLPGFSGAPINVVVLLDNEGKFITARLVAHNEPIFVSGLGEAPFHKFFEQYAGHSINTPMVVGTPYGGAGEGTDLVYLEGVTKATASVRIAHESILAATLQVAREKLKGLATAAPAKPNPAHTEVLSWNDLVAQGLVGHLRISNAEVDARFAGTLWSDDDPEARAKPQDTYLDVWVVDLGPPSLARAVLDEPSLATLNRMLAVSPDDEPLLVIDTGRHGLVSADFVRNTAPDRLSLEQDGFPIALRDADLLFKTLPDVPKGTQMILRTDRRLGFDPSREWVLKLQAVRSHGNFQPEIGSVDFNLKHRTDARFFLVEKPPQPMPPWLEALRGRAVDLALLILMLGGLLWALWPGMVALARQRHFRTLRLSLLAVMTGFVGWWGQGQLSIVTPLAVLRTALEGGSYSFLIYDPFSLVVWAAAATGFVLIGRGLFCGWLCPFGALQEFAHLLGRWLRLPKFEPSVRWDRRLKRIKYVLLIGLIAVVFVAPDQMDKAAEVEPFKTAITTYFMRDWFYVAYALGWLGLGLFTFKGFCRYVCPLGALMAIGGLLRRHDWIERREGCGNPCQLCTRRCAYGAINSAGKVNYSECFQCLDCVTIYHDPQTCVPLVLAAKGRHPRPKRGTIA